jgi:hypothetical protein
MPTKQAKAFDCVEMKRRIQEEIYEETRDMTPDELLAYFRARIKGSRFSDFLDTADVPPQAEKSRVGRDL